MEEKPIEEIKYFGLTAPNPIERSIIQDTYAHSFENSVKDRLKIRVLKALLEEAKKRHWNKVTILEG